MKRLFALAFLVPFAARAQAPAPAQMGVTETTPQTLNVLDRNNNWVTVGSFPPGGPFTVLGGTSNSPLRSVMAYGAVGDGATDDTAAINACLNDVPSGGGCLVGGLRFYVAGVVQVPLGRVLTCGVSPVDYSSNYAALNTAPALLLDPQAGGTIQGTGNSGGVENCLILNSHVHWPVNDGTPGNTSLALYAGIAVTDGNHDGFRSRNLMILGFDTALWSQGQRPLWENIIADGNGSNKAVYEWDGGWGDSGIVRNIEMATGYAQPSNCATMHRPGTAFRVGLALTPGNKTTASPLMMSGRIVLQGMQTADMELQNSFIGDTVWLDNNYITCGYGSEVGLIVDGTPAAGGGAPYVVINSLTSDQSNTGVSLGANVEFHVGDLFISGFNSGGGLQMGNSSGGPIVKVGNAVIGGGHANAPAISLNGASGLQTFRASSLRMNALGSPPAYILLNSNANVSFGAGDTQGGRYFSVNALTTDLAAGSNPFGVAASMTGKWLISSSARTEVAAIPPTAVACTGLGSTGTCNLFSPGVWNDSFSGVVQLKPSGTGIATTGTVTLTMPFAALTASMCIGATANATQSSWPGANSFVLPWFGTLTSGGTYQFLYRCNWT